MLVVTINMEVIMERKKLDRPVTLKKDLNNRLNRVSGQINGIIKMVNDNRYCADIIIQLNAAINSLKSISGIILQNHIRTCLKNTDENFDEKLEELIELIKRS